MKDEPPALTAAQERRIDQACDQFEAAWFSGHPASIDAYLEPAASEDRPHLLVELLLREIELRRSDGQSPVPCEYESRFPEYAECVTRAFHVGKTAANENGRATKSAAHPPRAIPEEAQLPTTAMSRDMEIENILSPPERDDEVGRIDKYRVLAVLGSGGMGIVFRADDPELERHVAIKAMKPSLANNDVAVQRFSREAKAIAAIDHEHVVAVHAVGDHRGIPFIVMKLLEGQSLDDRLRDEGRLPWREVLRIGRETAAGLAVAHGRGLIHRDVKPANIWLDSDSGRVKILDFGLAGIEGIDKQLTHSRMILGTANYMSPEQARSRPVDSRCDLFSLGCVLYKMSTGNEPFRGDDILAVLRAIGDHKPRPPHEGHADVPQPLSRLILKLLEKNPDDRIQTAASVIEEIQVVERQGLPDVGSPHVTRRQWMKRAAIGGIAVAALGGAGIALRNQWVPEEDPPADPPVPLSKLWQDLLTNKDAFEVLTPKDECNWQVVQDGIDIKAVGTSRSLLKLGESKPPYSLRVELNVGEAPSGPVMTSAGLFFGQKTEDLEGKKVYSVHAVSLVCSPDKKWSMQRGLQKHSVLGQRVTFSTPFVGRRPTHFFSNELRPNDRHLLEIEFGDDGLVKAVSWAGKSIDELNDDFAGGQPPPGAGTPSPEDYGGGFGVINFNRSTTLRYPQFHSPET